MVVSVCIAAFNGERFLEEQLRSLLRQSRQPDEVIICDDGSTDKTAEKTADFIREHSLENRWHLYRNRENKGYPGNFYYAMGLCKGDVVFLGDQDDVWEETKLERMVSVLEEHPEIMVLACKFGLIDSEDERIHTVMAPSRSLGTGKLRRVGLHAVFYRYEWPGMVLAYRNDWYRGSGRQAPEIPHDIFIAAMAAEKGEFLQLDRVLAYHRRHDSNAAGEEHRVSRLLRRDRKLWEVEKYLKMLDSFEKYGVLRTEEGKRILKAKVRAMEERYEALKSGKVRKVLGAALRNRKQVRLATVICDVTICRQEGDRMRRD